MALTCQALLELQETLIKRQALVPRESYREFKTISRFRISQVSLWRRAAKGVKQANYSRMRTSSFEMVELCGIGSPDGRRNSKLICTRNAIVRPDVLLSQIAQIQGSSRF